MKFKVLIVDDEPEIHDIVAFAFESIVEVDFLFATSGNEAFKVLTSNRDVDLVVSDFNMTDGNGGQLYQKMLESGSEVPFALCSSVLLADVEVFKEGKNILGQIVKPNIFEGVEELINKLSESRSVNLVYTKIYSPVKLTMVKAFSSAPNDIYIKINSEKYIKIFKENASIQMEELKKYEDKKLKYFYIEKQEAKNFVNLMIDSYLELLKEVGEKDNEKILDIHDVLIEVLSEYGLSEKVISLAKRSVELTIHMFSKNEKDVKIVKKIFGHKKEYLTQHSILLAYISCAIIEQLPWNTPENKDKLVMASFLHDATIKDVTLVEAEKSEKIYNFKEHPYEASELIRSFDDIPFDVDKIIIEHHEKPDGSGFPRGMMASQLSPLSSIFIFSHDVVDVLFNLHKNGKLLTKTAVMENLSMDYYTSGHFAKCYEAILKMELFDE